MTPRGVSHGGCDDGVRCGDAVVGRFGVVVGVGCDVEEGRCDVAVVGRCDAADDERCGDVLR